MSTKRKRRESNDEDVDGIFGTTPLNAKQRYRRIVYVPSIQTLIGSSSSTQTNFQHSFKWDHFLEEIRKQTAKDVELPGSLFGNPPMGSFLKAIQPGIKLEVRHYDYDALFPEKKIYWIASVLKIVGYRLLLRYEGMDKPGDDHRFDFWINLASDELQHVGYCKIHSVPCDLLPPNEIRERYDDWSSYISKKLINCKTLLANWEEERQIALVEGRFKVGTRLELLDRQSSDSLRPARVIQQLGRRICVRVSSKDVNEKDLGDDLAQIKTGIWCDESWELIFPVGWGRQNGWKVVANNQYLQHCEQIALAISQDRLPDYMPFDAMPEIFACGKDDEASSINTNLKENKAEWEVGMKFECLDPLNESFLELKVATCIEILKDGYLKIGFDGPDMESEAIPFHCTSPYLFPIYYANKYGIKLTGPLDNMKDFCWDKYIKQCQGIAAPESLFDKVPSPNEMEGFKIGSKLEATDQCESNLICPATIRAVRGRLLQIHFDGWGNDYDQLFDYRSRDLFPLGWCEIYGYKLEIPQNDEPLNTRKRR